MDKRLVILLAVFTLVVTSHGATITPTENIPSTVTFYLVKTEDNVTEVCVGDTVQFQLGVHFPSGNTDITVELFTPDNETTLMVVCDPQITSVGSNLAGVTTSFTPVMDAKDGTKNYDRAVFSINTVTNSGSDTISPWPSMMTITWSAAVIPTTRAIDGQAVWVSAGAETNNETEIWVGQTSFIYNTSCATFTPSESVSANLTGPGTIEVGTSGSFTLDIFVPYVTSDLIVDAILPTNSSGCLSVCGLVLADSGGNYKCTVAKESFNPTYTASTTGEGNDRAQLNLGTVINGNARSAGSTVADSTLTFKFTVYACENATVGDEYMVGITVRIGTTEIWAGLEKVAIAARTPAPNMTETPVFSLSNLGSSSLAAGQGTTLRLEIKTPANVEGDYLMEALMPVNDTSRIHICKVKVTYIGINLPCQIESTPVLSSRDPSNNTTMDKASWNLGKIKDYNYRTDAQDPKSSVIWLDFVIQMLNHSLNTDGDTLTMSVGVQFSETRIWVGQETITINDTQTTDLTPTFGLSYAFGTGEVHVGASAYILLEMTVPPGAVFKPMDIEFLMPTYQNDSALFSLCRVEILSVGDNMPCLSQATVNSSIVYTAGVDGKIYRASVSFGGTNNVAASGTNETDADKIMMAMIVKVEDHIALQNGTIDWPAIGMMYLTTKLWVGQIALVALRDDSISMFQNGTVYADFENSSITAYQGETFTTDFLIKIPAKSTYKLSVSVTPPSDLSVCTLYVVESGTNVPCLNTPSVGNVTWSSDRTRGESLVLDLGYVTNIGLTEELVQNATFDNNTIRLRLVVRVLSSASSGNLPLIYSVDGSDTTVNLNVDIQTGSSSPNASKVPTFTYYMAAMDDNDTSPTGDMFPGESAIFRLDIEPIDMTPTTLTVKFMAPSNSTQPMEVSAVGLVHTGANVPCLQRGSVPGVLSSRSNNDVMDVGTVNVGHVCSVPIKSDNASKVITVEGVGRMRPGALVTAGDSFWFSVAVNIDSNIIYVGQLQVTVASTFTEQYFNASELVVQPALSLSPDVPVGLLELKIGEEILISYILTFPPNKTVIAATDLSLPFNVSACATVVSVNVTDVGANVGGGASSAASFDNITMSSTNGTSQYDSAYLYFGVITNSGFTYRIEKAEDSDNQVNMTVRLQIADCPLNEPSAELALGLGAKIGPVIIVLDKIGQVQRDGTESPNLILESSLEIAEQVYSNGDTVAGGGCLKHNESSNAEGLDVKVNYFLPPYVKYGSITSYNGTAPTVESLSQATGFSLKWSNLFFTDHFCFNFTLTVDLTEPRPSTTESYLLATTPYQAGANMYDRVSVSNFPAGSRFYTIMNHLPINVTGGCSDGCGSANSMLSGLDDCQIMSSSPRATLTQLTSHGSFWTPRVRCITYPTYLEFNFGNLTKVTQINLKQIPAAGHTQVTSYQIKYRIDAKVWTDGELVTGLTSADHNHMLPCPVKLRHLRLEVKTVATPNTPIGLNVDVRGCTASSETTAGFCSNYPWRANIPSTDVQSELMDRSFLVIPGDIAFICDANPAKPASWLYPDGEYTCVKTQGCGASNSWTVLDSQIMTIIGYDSKDGAIYGIAKYKRNFVMSLDMGTNWYSIPVKKYTQASTEATFTKALNVQMSHPAGAFPSYTFSTWQAQFDGVYCSGNKILDWCFM